MQDTCREYACCSRARLQCARCGQARANFNTSDLLTCTIYARVELCRAGITVSRQLSKYLSRLRGSCRQQQRAPVGQDSPCLQPAAVASCTPVACRNCVAVQVSPRVAHSGGGGGGALSMNFFPRLRRPSGSCPASTKVSSLFCTQLLASGPRVPQVLRGWRAHSRLLCRPQITMLIAKSRSQDWSLCCGVYAPMCRTPVHNVHTKETVKADSSGHMQGGSIKRNTLSS